MPPLVQSLTTRTLSGFFWMSLATGTSVLAQLVVLVILARLLAPADFGVATAALMVVTFSGICSSLGIGPAIVQRPDLQKAHLRCGFTLSVLLGMLFTMLVWFTAPAIAGFFHLAELTPILRTLSLLFPVQGLAVVAESLLQRELRFRCLALVDVVTAGLAYGVTGVTLALYGFAAWSLVGAYLAQLVLRTVLLLFLRPHPALPLLEWRACRDLLYFGSGFTASGISNYLAGQAENLVIGRYLGAVALGVYGRAYQLMAGPAVVFGTVLDRVLFPAMVQVQNQPDRLAAAYRRGSALIALMILPVSGVLVVLAPEAVHVILGPEWHAVTLPLQILGVGMLFRTGCKISDSLVRATGAVYRRTWRQAAYAILVAAGALVGQEWGVEGVCVAVLATLAVNFFLMAHLALRLAGMTWRTFAAAHVSGLALAVLVTLPVAGAAKLLRAGDLSPLLVLVGSAATALPSVIAACCLPRLFLGNDGQWMARKLLAFLFPRPQDEKSAGTSSMSDLGNASLLVETSALAAESTGSSPTWEKHPLFQLTRSLARAGVRYCRWKSQLDLQRVLTGEGDLDLLVARQDAEAFLAVAQSHAFARVVPCFAPDRTEEWHCYGLDPETGALLHLHLHFTLSAAAGLEELVLRHSLPDTAPGLLQGMPVVLPGAELIALVLHTMEQYSYLVEHPRLRAKRDRLACRLNALLAAESSESWRSLLESGLLSVSPNLFAESLSALIQPTASLYCCRLAGKLRRPSRSRTGSVTQKAIDSVPGLLQRVWWRLSHGRGSPKQLVSGGRVIAIVGPDASGKSTMVAETTAWLGKVFRVRTAHLGKPPATWLTVLPNLGWNVLCRAVPRLRGKQHTVAERTLSRKPGLLYSLRAVLLAWDRRALALRLSRLARRGWLIVCDRYPSAGVGAADGARLAAPEETGQTGVGAWLARLENRLYREIPQPDMILRLSAPVAVAVDRNKERQKAGKESDAYITRRHKNFVAPRFTGVRTIEVDTNKPRTETLHRLRRLVWDLLRSSDRRDLSCAEDVSNPHLPREAEEERVEFQQQ
jgi:O-antigen/teichoic acid export membrane protein/thymidylate kinase